jgi:GNAT superfamily N-acetyltransferase
MLQIVPVTSAVWEALDAFFAAAPTTSCCWCMWPRAAPSTFEPGYERHRDSFRSIVLGGEVPGLVGIQNGQVVAWCAVGPRSTFPKYEEPFGPNAWAIPCIIVRTSSKRADTARALIKHAVDYASAHGAEALEGPPPRWLPADDAALQVLSEALVVNGFEATSPKDGMPAPKDGMPTLRRVLRRPKPG